MKAVVFRWARSAGLGVACLLVVTVAAANAPPAPGPASPPDLSVHVNPFIGTDGHGHTYPGATLPFGMVQLSPDTRLEGWDACSGYHWTDTVIHGFSHTHLSGTGIADYADILLAPASGMPRLDRGLGGATGPGRVFRFHKATERAEPGFYGVRLADEGIDVELTATERTGLHRYRFPPGRPIHVVVDLAHRDPVVSSSLRVVSEREIEGTRRSSSWARDQVVHFVARFSRPFGFTLMEAGEPRPDVREVSGTDLRAVLAFDAGVMERAGSSRSTGELLVKVGLSAVDVEGARRNLDAEQPGWDFEAVHSAARRTWNEALGKIQVEGGTARQRTIFYTALYHSLLAPNVYSDVDGRYRGMNGKVHVAEGRRHYTVFSLWDTFRALHPLLVLMEPERTREFLQTFLAMYEQGGRLPVWELAGNETDTMIGYHAVPVMVDAWVKGIRGFDAGAALAAMIDSAERDHFGLAAYKRKGFIDSRDESESVSKTLEYAYDDWCIARMAGALGREETASRFARRSQGWRHLLDPETGFMRPRVDGRWLTPFDPRTVDNHYTEANAWQYSFFVPQDVHGLMAALGGDAAFVRRLDDLFEADPRTIGRDQPDITGLMGQYAHGNEPSHHVAWLYHHAGRPDRSAERVHQILETLYRDGPDGLSGNDDCGQMSSWYVLAAIGLFPVTPCSDEYLVAPPLFDRVVVDLGGGRSLRIGASGAGGTVGGPSGARRYVAALRIGEDEVTRSFVRHAEMLESGKLELTLARKPSATWGRGEDDRPGRFGARPAAGAVVAAPYAEVSDRVFRERTTVRLVSALPETTLRYRVHHEGSEPSPAGWTDYQEPLVLDRSVRVEFYAVRGDVTSPVVETSVHRMPHDWTVQVRTPPNPRYTAGGPEALIDGIRGPEDWRIGDWHGYQGVDFEATVDLGRPMPLRRAGAGFLQDSRSWIWMPREMKVFVSQDGVTFQPIAGTGHDVADDASSYGVTSIRDLLAELPEGTTARYVRIHARGFGTIPEWHPGAGGESFIFVDEILVD